MNGQPTSRILITASASDIYDGLQRLIVVTLPSDCDVIIDKELVHGSREKPVPIFSRYALDKVSTSGRADASASTA